MQLGLEHADRLNKLGLITPIGADGFASDEAIREAGRKLRAERAIETLVRQRLAGLAREERQDEARARRGVERALSTSDGHYEGGLRARAEFEVGARLGEITTPTLMVTGAADAFLETNLLDFMRLPNATLHVFSRVGHGVDTEVPAALARVLADFMEHGVVNAATLQARLQPAEASS